MPNQTSPITHLAEIAETAHLYFEARQLNDTPALNALTAPIWHGKRLLAGGEVELETRTALLCRSAGEPARLNITALIPCFADFAVARGDDWVRRETALIFLFKQRRSWLVAGDARADAAAGESDARFRARQHEAEVLRVLEEYYRVVTAGEPNGVRNIFAPCWHMKNHDEEAPPAEALLLAEETDAFAARLEHPLPGYWDDRQVHDVHVVANRLAYVRVDRPSSPSTTVFLFAHMRSGWKVLDKAWTDGRKEPQ